MPRPPCYRFRGDGDALGTRGRTVGVGDGTAVGALGTGVAVDVAVGVAEPRLPVGTETGVAVPAALVGTGLGVAPDLVGAAVGVRGVAVTVAPLPAAAEEAAVAE